jgi:hypothetical protein
MLFREGLLIVILIIAVLNILLKNFNRFIFSFQLFSLGYIIIIEFYAMFLSSKNALSSFILYASGPILFFSTPYNFFDEKNIKNLIKGILFILFGFLIVNMILYPFQSALLLVSDVDQLDVRRHLFRYTRNGRQVLRFFGLTFMPTALAWISVIVLVSPFGKLVKKVMSFGVLYFTSTRVFFPGLVYVFYSKTKKKFRIYLFFVLLLMLIFLILYFSKGMDISLSIHLNHLFIEGPSLLIENIFGRGIGDINIGLESDIYMISIRFGIIGLCAYIGTFIKLYFFLNKKRIRDDAVVIFGRNLLLIYFIASWFIPLTGIRSTSNLFWILMALVSVYGRIECKKTKLVQKYQ